MSLTFKLVGTFILLTMAFNSYAGIGLSDWVCKTPYGNEIQNNGGIFLYLKDGRTIEGLNRWYFYKGYIIGKKDSSEYYFAVNEKTAAIFTFPSEQEWDRFIETRNLRPSFWRRWYEKDWEYFDDILFISLVFFYVSVPLLILFFWIVYKSIKREKMSFKKPFTIALAIIVSFILANFLLEQFPQSW